MSPPPIPVSASAPGARFAVGPRATPAIAAGPALTIVAIADDPALLDALARAGREGDAVITSPTADRFVDQLVANAAAIAVIDAACAPPPLERFIERIHAQFPQLLLILAGSAPLQAAFAARLVDGTLFRFAHKPASAQRMQLFIDAARRHLEAGVPGADPGRGAEDLGPDAPRPAGRLRPALFGVALLVTVFCLGWWELRPGTALPAPAAPSPVPAAPAATAAAAMPALPARPEPVAEDLLASYTAVGTAAILATLRALPPVPAAMPPGPFLALARARLSSHDLVEPAGDSALFYVEAAQALAPEDPEVGTTALALGEALIAQTRAALSAGDAEAARRWLRTCTDYRVNGNTIAELSERLQQLEAAAPPAGSRAP